jgi:adenylate cyclase
VLAEFASVVDAVRCAVGIQEELKDRNRELPEDRRMEFRIGINLGDVIEEGDTIYGDGVNIAARLESLADAGGICISGTVYDQIKNKLAFSYDYVGEQTVKNIKEPVRVYRVLMEPGVRRAERGLRSKVKGKRALALGILAVFMVVVVAVALWQFYLRPAPPPHEVASKEKMAFPLPALPSIAVLPFDNMSKDPKEEFFSDGITESIITALSRVPRLFVIARNSTFTYKGKPVKVKQVSEELGVRYVLEGSVQRSGDRVRITAQLIDALTGHHIWAERYDRDLKDIFALQDEVTLKILNAMRVKLTEGEQARRPSSMRSQNLNCYLKMLEGWNYYERVTAEGNTVARRIAEEAIAMCPEDPEGYMLLAWVYYLDYWFGSTRSPQENIEKAIELAQKIIAMDDSIAGAHYLLSALYSMKREYEKAMAEGERGVALAPSGANAHEFYANSLTYAGRVEEAIPLYQKAMRLNPFSDSSTFLHLGHALRITGRFEEAVSEYKKSLQRTPNNIFAHLGLTASYSLMGREKEARAGAAEVLRINPKFSLDLYAKRLPYKDKSVIDNYIDALRKAGLK